MLPALIRLILVWLRSESVRYSSTRLLGVAKHMVKLLQAAALAWFKVGQGSLGRVLHCSFPPGHVDVCDVEMRSHNIYQRNNDVWFGSLPGAFPSTRLNLHPKLDGADFKYSCSWPLINPCSGFSVTLVGLYLDSRLTTKRNAWIVMFKQPHLPACITFLGLHINWHDIEVIWVTLIFIGTKLVNTIESSSMLLIFSTKLSLLYQWGVTCIREAPVNYW